MLHGNVLLRGWTTADLSYYTTELPQYALVELAHGLNADVVHIATAMTYTLLVLGAALLARGHAAGREGAVRMLVAAGIMLAPSLGTATATLLSNPNHTGTQVPMLVIWLILDRARPRWWVPVLVSVLLTWVQVGDPLVLYEGVVPLVIVCAIRAYRRRGPLSESWYELSLAAGAIISAGAAALALKVIHDLGGFDRPAADRDLRVRRHPVRQIWVAVESVLGAVRRGLLRGSSSARTLSRAGPPGRGGAGGVGDLPRAAPVRAADLVVQVLAVTAVVLLVAYVLRGNPVVAGSNHEIAGVLPVGAVLAGRLLAGSLIRGPAHPGAGLVLACYLGILAHNVVQQPAVDANQQLAAWLQANNLRYGLGDYWNANAITLDSGNQVQVRNVSRVGDKLMDRPWDTKSSWYDPAQHDATFLVTPGPADVCSPGTPAGWQAVARDMFGPPSATYHVGGFFVLVWHENLLSRLGTGPMHGPVQC